jgi:hypothetical protein
LGAGTTFRLALLAPEFAHLESFFTKHIHDGRQQCGSSVVQGAASWLQYLFTEQAPARQLLEQRLPRRARPAAGEPQGWVAAPQLPPPPAQLPSAAREQSQVAGMVHVGVVWISRRKKEWADRERLTTW